MDGLGGREGLGCRRVKLLFIFGDGDSGKEIEKGGGKSCRVVRNREC